MVEWNHRNAAITAVAFDSAAGSYVASAAEDGTVAARHLDTGKMLDPTTASQDSWKNRRSSSNLNIQLFTCPIN
jgi:WD40 repeat protein